MCIILCGIKCGRKWKDVEGNFNLLPRLINLTFSTLSRIVVAVASKIKKLFHIYNKKLD